MNQDGDGTAGEAVDDRYTGNFALSISTFIGVDFGPTGDVSPTNWNFLRGTTIASGTVLSDLITESGGPTTIDLTLVTSNATAFATDTGAPLASQIPTHSTSLANIGGNIWTNAGPTYTLTFSSLVSGGLYEVYVFGLDTAPGQQSITVSGQGTPANFTQNYGTNQLWVNGSAGSSGQALSSYAVLVTASAGGTITIQASRTSGFLGIAGLAIRQTQVSATPGTPDLLAATDTGASSTDNITNRDNRDAANNLQFLVPGTVSGATVTIFADGTPIGSAVAGGTTTTITTNGTLDLADGTRSITARQTEPGLPQSAISPALSITIDTAAPTADVVDVTPDPRSTPVTSITITFNQAISSFDLLDLSLTRNGGANLLTGSQTLNTSDNITWTLGNLTALTTPGGNYLLTLTAAGSGIIDVAGNLLAANASDAFAVTLAAPTLVDLLAATDTGVSSTDNITNRDNRDAANNLQFQVSGTVVGATVTIYADGAAIGSAVASGTTTTITTNGTLDLADGLRSITARQNEPGGPESANSPALSVTIDTAAPTADVVDVRRSANLAGKLNHDRFQPGDQLVRAARPVFDAQRRRQSPHGRQTLTSSDNITWTLGNLSALTTPAGNYLLTLTAAGSVSPIWPETCLRPTPRMRFRSQPRFRTRSSASTSIS